MKLIYVVDTMLFSFVALQDLRILESMSYSFLLCYNYLILQSMHIYKYLMVL